MITHGSRRKKSNGEIIALACKIETHHLNQYPIIHAGFLEIASPQIPESIKQCIDDRATSIVLLPYFLNSGRHVIEDTPAFINETQKNFPNVPITVTSHIGGSTEMINLLIKTVNDVKDID